MNNANVTNIKTDSEYSRGYCDTCDIGEEYISIVEFEFTDKDLNFKVEYSSTFTEPINQSIFIRTILNNVDRFEQMSYEEFKSFFDNLQNSTDKEASEFYDLVCNI